MSGEGGFTLNPQLRAFVDAFEGKHGTTVEASGSWGHAEAQPPATGQAASGALPVPGPPPPPPPQATGIWGPADAQLQAATATIPGAPLALDPPPPPPPQAEAQALVSFSTGPTIVQPLTVAPAVSSAPADPNRLEGVVIDWRESYGFVQFNDGRRAYVHNSMCGGASLLAGQAITGICVPDTKNPGKWQAQQVERKISVAPDGRLEGKVQQWTGNFGFIQFCDGRRAFCHSSFLTGAAAGSVLSEGQAVVGNVQEDPKNPGKWQAQNVEVLPSLAPDNSGRVEGKVTQWNGTYGFVQFSDGRRAYVSADMCVGGTPLAVGQKVFGIVVEDPAIPGKWQAQNVEGEPGRMDGIVTQWSDKGFGFIDFVDGRHAFVHSSACGGKHLSQGEAVSAVIVADQQNTGKWMAKSVILKGPPGEDCTVTDWREKGGWGFVLLDSGTSAFIHASSFGGGGNLAIGMRLRVTTKFDAAKGRMAVEQVTGVAELSVQQLTEAANMAAAAAAAREAEAATAAAAAAAAAAAGGAESAEVAEAAAAAAVAAAEGVPPLQDLPAELSTLASTLGLTMPSAPSSESELGMSVRTAGRVSEWNSSGFGFAMMEDGRRVYVHNSQCGGQHLQQGETITALVIPDPRNYGKWAAQSVERLGGGVVATGAAATAHTSADAEQAAKRQRFGP